MKTWIATAAAAAALATPAFAQDFSLKFDSQLLETATGRAEVMQIIRDEAAKVCLREASVTRRFTGLDACRTAMVREMVDATNRRIAAMAPVEGVKLARLTAQ